LGGLLKNRSVSENLKKLTLISILEVIPPDRPRLWSVHRKSVEGRIFNATITTYENSVLRAAYWLGAKVGLFPMVFCEIIVVQHQYFSRGKP
jgi:hypothetical protein